VLISQCDCAGAGTVGRGLLSAHGEAIGALGRCRTRWLHRLRLFLFLFVNIIVNGAIDKTTALVIETRKVLPTPVRPMFGMGKRVLIVNTGIDKESVRSQSKFIQSILGKSGEHLGVTHASIGKY